MGALSTYNARVSQMTSYDFHFEKPYTHRLLDRKPTAYTEPWVNVASFSASSSSPTQENISIWLSGHDTTGYSGAQRLNGGIRAGGQSLLRT
jgi:hypothetical protein